MLVFMTGVRYIFYDIPLADSVGRELLGPLMKGCGTEIITPA
jgi:hypothetical protein